MTTLPCSILLGAVVRGVAVTDRLNDSRMRGIVLGADGEHAIVVWGVGMPTPARTTHILFDLADPLTRCAVARALAVRVGLHPGTTAPSWTWIPRTRAWELACTDGGAYWFGSLGRMGPAGTGGDAAGVALAMAARAVAEGLRREAFAALPDATEAGALPTKEEA